MILYGTNGQDYGFYTEDCKEKLKSFVEVEEDYRDELIWEANTRGKKIVPDSQGFPVCIEPSLDKTANDILEETPYKIKDLCRYLQSTDWVVIKIMEGVATEDKYKEILRKRKDARYRINELQKKLESIGENTIPIPS